MPSSRQALLGASVLALAFVGGFLLVRRPTPPPPATAPATAPAPLPVVARAEVVDAPAPSPSPVRYSVRTESIVEVPTDEPQVRSLARTAAEDYRQRARYPRSSQPISDGVDPIERDREVTPGTSLGPEGRDPTLVIYPERASVEAPNAIVLHAYLVQDGTKVDARAITGDVRTQQGGVLAALAFHDDGADGDADAHDLVYTAVVAPGRERAQEFKGAQLVAVRAETLAREERTATTGILYSVPLAHLTGRYRDALVDGSVVVSAEVDVHAEGRFHLEATLAASDGTPVAWAQNAAVLAPGLQWIPLTYFGLVLRERRVEGPWLLRSVALSTTGEMPNQKNDVAANAYTTAAYPLAALSDRAYDDPDLLEAARRLEDGAPPGALEAATR